MSPHEAALHAGQHLGPIVLDRPSQAFMCLRGVAASRARTFQPRTIEEARRCVSDLGVDGDEEVREELAWECLRTSPLR